MAINRFPETLSPPRSNSQDKTLQRKSLRKNPSPPGLTFWVVRSFSELEFMGSVEGKASKPNSDDGGIIETPVVVNVYDLTPLNNYTSWFGFGIFHSGIEVHGKEYGFGAHDLPVSGVFSIEPRNCPGFIYRCSISLGFIKMTAPEFEKFLENVTSEYHGCTYQLLTKNCNHFTDDIVWRLTGKHLPGWVNRLARTGYVCSCLLPESLQATTVKPLPEYHECFEDENLCSSEDGVSHEHIESDEADRDKLLPTSQSAEVELRT